VKWLGFLHSDANPHFEWLHFLKAVSSTFHDLCAPKSEIAFRLFARVLFVIASDEALVSKHTFSALDSFNCFVQTLTEANVTGPAAIVHARCTFRR
jgi:hypothetical protein